MTYLLIWAALSWDCPWWVKGDALKPYLCKQSVSQGYLLTAEPGAIQDKLSALGPLISAQVYQLPSGRRLHHSWKPTFE